MMCNIYLSEIDSYFIYDDDVSSFQTIKHFFIKRKDKNIYYMLDERDNTLAPVPSNKRLEDDEIFKYLSDKLDTLKKTDVEYGRTIPFFYEPIKSISLEVFTSYLIKENRDMIISNILK